MNEEDKFLDDLKVEDGKVPEFDEPISKEETLKEETPKDEDDPEMQPESVKDRRHRRLEEKLRQERESNIQLNARLQAIAEAKAEANSQADDYLKAVERIYGTDTPETTAATELLKNALRTVEERARESALSTLREERAQEAQELAKEEANLDTMVEDLEDEYGIDLTSPKGDATRKAFFKELEKMSPKDSEGNIIAYADHHAVWESLQARTKKPENKAKALASRAMTPSGQGGDSTLQEDATWRILRDQFGW